MVTFVCSYCDTTLKKKQCENHVKGRCRPGSLICIDCHKTFYNNEFKDHISCVTEQQKHWGQYAPQKKQKNNNQQVVKQQKQQQLKVENAGFIQEAIQQKQEKKCTLSDWKGWKNELKEIIKTNNNQIQLQALKKKAMKRYKKKTGQQVSGELIEQKVNKIKKIKKQVYVSLDE